MTRASAITVGLLGTILFLSACGGGGRDAPRRADVPALGLASGPISQACNRSGRAAATRQLCGCVQSAANLHLSSEDQSLAVTFYNDPQRAQNIRQSDSRRNEAFWTRYKAFVADSERYCSELT